MKQLYLWLSLTLLLPTTLLGQYDYEANGIHPYGRPNPEAPSQILDFDAMIGECDCQSTRRKPDGTWGKPEPMLWRFKYIMNGMAIQDETLKPNGAHTGNIRQFIADSSKWYVHYYSNSRPSTTFPVWEGGKKEKEIVLYRDQKAPNGAEGYYKIRFYDMSKRGYKWSGAWVSADESIVFDNWNIVCVRPEEK
ncbi:MAG: hypothetical protein ABJM06_03780 [Gilvibacter sp.]